MIASRTSRKERPQLDIVIKKTMFSQVKKAFFALVANGVRAAPLWDNKLKCFVGEPYSKCPVSVTHPKLYRFIRAWVMSVVCHEGFFRYSLYAANRHDISVIKRWVGHMLASYQLPVDSGQPRYTQSCLNLKVVFMLLSLLSDVTTRHKHQT